MATKRDSSGSSGPTADLPPPPAKRTRTTKQEPLALDASWSDLRPELVASVAKFVDIGSDLTNLCIVAGPVVSGVIRTTYLRNNDDYLRHMLIMQKAQRDVQTWRVRSWMEANADWAQRCGVGEKVGAAAAGAVVVMKLQPAEALAMEFKRGLGRSMVYVGRESEVRGTDGVDRLADDEVTRLQEAKGRFMVYTGSHDVPFNGVANTVREGDVLLAVGDTRVGPDMPVEVVRSLIASYDTSGREVVLRFIRSGSDFILKDPLATIKLGLTDVLKVMVEKRFVGANDHLVLSERDDANSLLWYVLFFAPDRSILTYLLSRNETDCSLDCDSSIPGRTIVHYVYHDNVTLDECRALIQHKSAHVNKVDSQGMTPLSFVCSNITREDVQRNLKLAKFKMLLEAGADPYADLGNGVSAIAYLHQLEANKEYSDEVHECAQNMLALAENVRLSVAHTPPSQWGRDR